MKALDNHIEFISNGMGSFTIEDKLRYIDLDNINKYKKNDVYSILSQFDVWTNINYSKKVLIQMLMNDPLVIAKIKVNNKLYNRQMNLNNLLVD